MKKKILSYVLIGLLTSPFWTRQDTRVNQFVLNQLTAKSKSERSLATQEALAQGYISLLDNKGIITFGPIVSRYQTEVNGRHFNVLEFYNAYGKITNPESNVLGTTIDDEIVINRTALEESTDSIINLCSNNKSLESMLACKEIRTNKDRKSIREDIKEGLIAHEAMHVMQHQGEVNPSYWSSDEVNAYMYSLATHPSYETLITLLNLGRSNNPGVRYIGENVFNRLANLGIKKSDLLNIDLSRIQEAIMKSEPQRYIKYYFKGVR